LFIIVSGLLASSFIGSSPYESFEIKDQDQIAEDLVDFIKNNMVAEGTEVSVKDITDERGLYMMTIEVKSGAMSQEVESYVTKDGEVFFPQAINIEEVKVAMEQGQQEAESQEVPKSDRPEAHAFVMSYCPYGLQFMKAYVPVMELLGEEADLELNFVSYIMHGEKEIEENNRMYCIQKEQGDKLTDYLRCFLGSDDYGACLATVGIDSDMLDTCIASADEEFGITELYNDKSTWSGGRYPPYPVDGDLNDEYGVGGSPTFVINGKTVSVQRSSEAIKEAICSAFNNPPADCDEELNSEAEEPGIGPIGSGSGSASGGSCG